MFERLDGEGDDGRSSGEHCLMHASNVVLIFGLRTVQIVPVVGIVVSLFMNFVRPSSWNGEARVPGAPFGHR